jgi:hypothetical protein
MKNYRQDHVCRSFMWSQDALARQSAVTHDIKEDIERPAREYGKLGEPWQFVAK